MSFLKTADPEKRDFIVKELLKTKQNIRKNFAEKLGDLRLHRELTKLYKPVTDSQAAQSASLTKALSNTSTALKALPAALSSKLKAISFPQFPSIQAGTDEVPLKAL